MDPSTSGSIIYEKRNSSHTTQHRKVSQLNLSAITPNSSAKNGKGKVPPPSMQDSFLGSEAGRSPTGSSRGVGWRVASPLQNLPTAELNELRDRHPAALGALQQYEVLLQSSEERYRAKEAELHRCISVGQELLEQIDQMKQQCLVLAEERDAALQALAATSQQQQSEAKNKQTLHRTELQIVEKERQFWAERERVWDHKREDMQKELEALRADLRHRDEAQQSERHQAQTRVRALEGEVQRLRQEATVHASEMAKSEVELQQAKKEIDDLLQATHTAQQSFASRTEQLADALQHTDRLPASAELVAVTHLATSVINQLFDLKEEVSRGPDDAAPSAPVGPRRLKAPEAQEQPQQGHLLGWLLEALRKGASLISEASTAAAALQRQTRQSELKRSEAEAARLLLEEEVQAQEAEADKMQTLLKSLRAEAKRIAEEAEAAKSRESRNASDEVQRLQQVARDAAAERDTLQQQLKRVREEAEVEKCSIVQEARIEMERQQRVLQRREEELALLHQQRRTQTSHLASASRERSTNTTAVAVEEMQTELSELQQTCQEERNKRLALEASLAEAHKALQAAKEAAEEGRRRLQQSADEEREKYKAEAANLREVLQATHEETQRELQNAHKLKSQLMEELYVVKAELEEAAQEVVPELRKENKDLRRRCEAATEEAKMAQAQWRQREEQLKSADASVGALREKLQEVEESYRTARQTLQAQSATATRTTADLESCRRALQQREAELRDTQQQLSHVHNTVSALRKQNQALQAVADKYSGEDDTVVSKLRAELKALREEQDQLRRGSQEAAQSAREMEATVRHLKKELTESKEECDRAEAWRRKVERFLVEAPTSSVGWDTMSGTLRAAAAELRARVAAAAAPLEHQAQWELFSTNLEQLLLDIAHTTEQLCDRQNAAWERVRRKVISNYELPSSSRLSLSIQEDEQDRTTQALVAEDVLCVDPYVYRMLRALQEAQAQTVSAPTAGAFTADEVEELRAEAKAQVGRLEHDLRLVAERAQSMEAHIQSAREELAQERRRTKLLQQELEETNQHYQDNAAELREMESKLAAKAHEQAAERARLTVQLEEAQRAAQQGGEGAAELQQCRRQLKEAEQRLKAAQGLAATLHQTQEELAAAKQGAQRLQQQHQEALAAVQEENARLQLSLRRVREETAALSETLQQRESGEAQKHAAATAAMRAELERQLAERQRELTLAREQLETHEQDVHSLELDVKYLQTKVTTAQQEREMLVRSHAAEREELEGLRRVNVSLEKRLAEIEGDRDPLRQQLHSLLTASQRN